MMTNMKLLIGIVCMLQVYKGQCSIFENIRVKTENDGNVLAILVDPATNSTPLEIRFNLSNRRNKSANGRKENGTLRAIKDCSSNKKQHCRETEDGIRLLMQKSDEHCQSFNYSSTGGTLIADINISDIHLYGGSIDYRPIDEREYNQNAYVTSASHPILEPYWLASNGYYIYVDEAVPLFISLDPKTRSFKLIAENTLPYVKPNPNSTLSFIVCKLKNVRIAHEHAVKHVLGTPLAVPDLNLVKYPTWTYLPFDRDMNEQEVLKYAEEIVQHGYGGQLVIVHGWERCSHSLEPDTNKFPDLRRLVQRLKQLDFVRVTLSVHPFVNVSDCNSMYSTGEQRGYLVRDYRNRTFIHRGFGYSYAIVDFTNPQAINWYRERLMEFGRRYGFNSFTFQSMGTHDMYTSNKLKFHKSDDRYPETILIEEFMKMIASVGTNVGISMARNAQHYPIFVSLQETYEIFENVGWRMLAPSDVITYLLQLNILGYSFVNGISISDSLGSVRYIYSPASQEILGEGLIRSLQASLFMPSIEIMDLPWTFGPIYNDLTKKFLDLRSQFTDKIIYLMHKNVVTGAPVNPPIWWIAPNDPEALVCETEYLLGEDLLVAPVLRVGETSRDVYLPEGNWRDENNSDKKLIKGPTWLRSYPANLSVLPYFTRVPADGERTNF